MFETLPSELSAFELHMKQTGRVDTVPEPENPHAKFQEQAALAGRTGWRFADGLNEEIAERGTRDDQVVKSRESAQDEWEEIISTEQVLQKRFTPKQEIFKTVISPNKKWQMNYDSQGNLISGSEINP